MIRIGCWLALIVAVAGCSSQTCSITVQSVTAETTGGQATLAGNFTDGQPIMVLTATDGTPSFISCAVASDDHTATCNIGGLVALGTYTLTFHVSCDNDGNGTVDDTAGDSFQVTQ